LAVATLTAAADLLRQDQTHQHCHKHYHVKHFESCHGITLVLQRKEN